MSQEGRNKTPRRVIRTVWSMIATARDAAVSMPKPSRGYEWHLPTLIYIIVALFLAVGAVNSQNNLLFWAFGFAVGLMIISGVLSGAALMGLSVTRHPMPTTSAGQPAAVRYTITNRNRFIPAFGLIVSERFETPGAPDIVNSIHMVRARSVRHVVTGFTPKYRGLYRSRSVVIQTTFPFGLTKKRIEYPQPDLAASTLVVGPKAVRIRSDVLRPLAHIKAPSSNTLDKLGQGDEFYGLREYRAGDPIRRVAWLPSARTDRLVVRQLTSTAPPRVIVSLDAPPPGVRSDDFERAVALAAGARAAAMRKGFAVGLSIPWAGLLRPPTTSAVHDDQLTAALAALTPDSAHEPSDDLQRSSALSAASIRVVFDRNQGGEGVQLRVSEPRDWLAAGQDATSLPSGPTAAVPRLRRWRNRVLALAGRANTGKGGAT